MKVLCLMYFSHIVYSFYFHPHSEAKEPLRKNEKIAGGSFYFLSEIVTTFESLEGCVSFLHGRPSQMNSDTFVIAQSRECCSVTAGGENGVFPRGPDLLLPPSRQEQR